MKKVIRENEFVSLCGLNCGLCPMKIDGYCPGCGRGSGCQTCSILKCREQQGEYEFCYECIHFPCDKYKNIEEFDSFITHKNQLANLLEIKKDGIEKYTKKISKKSELLNHLLKYYNNGRRKTYFCIAVSLLDISDIETILEEIESSSSLKKMSINERSKVIYDQINKIAENKDIELKLRKKKK